MALDPARADFYYFWGECLRRQGKPREAVGKFHSALLRNQYENAEDLYQLKLWLSEIQADQEETSGANARSTPPWRTTPRPPYERGVCGGGPGDQDGQFTRGGGMIAQGQQITEPVVFRVILQDPTFLQESWRPELRRFYKP